MEKKCLECGDAFKGRIDKKFCSDLCRNAFNNKANSETSNFVRNVNNILRKNRKILENLVPEETAKASKQKLVDKGFNFQYYTHTYTNKKGTAYYFCYEYGYLPIEGGYYFLVKRKEEK
jgi:hypothetical protein